MIKTELISANTLKITVPERLKADDFQQLGPQIDSLIRQQGQIRLLIDASNFGGWENIGAFEKHIGFVKNHHQKVGRITVIARHDWQHWVIGTIRLFLHPQVRAYDKSSESEALQWIAG
jgi:SpoIIAA-like